jgi:hypothetical protein
MGSIWKKLHKVIYIYCISIILCMELFPIIICWCSIQIKPNDTTCMYMEVVNPRCIDSVTFKDYEYTTRELG